MAPVTPRLILTAFILAHALIHVAFLGPRPPATAGDLRGHSTSATHGSSIRSGCAVNRPDS